MLAGVLVSTGGPMALLDKWFGRWTCYVMAFRGHAAEFLRPGWQSGKQARGLGAGLRWARTALLAAGAEIRCAQGLVAGARLRTAASPCAT